MQNFTTDIPTVDDREGILRGPRRTDILDVEEAFETAAILMSAEQTQEATDSVKFIDT